MPAADGFSHRTYRRASSHAVRPSAAKSIWPCCLPLLCISMGQSPLTPSVIRRPNGGVFQAQGPPGSPCY